ncbi:hypothetical protein [Pseudoxanthomonas sacheonensis]|uniref:EthD domain-containing protein n=1 Tax=Pseudoxanthomonas sacheonensis TaxID=443615 RepID=A0ABU1RWX7_9GAMM|nr:hypothetical protein [Pseudoxanthomonas sacheonensis]MDR6842405.1 hypothetical protein [Pseudoxanthomonas sacheonensis]
MKLWPKIYCIVILAFGSYAQAQVASAATASVPVTVEYYYRIKWGDAEEFLRLYDKNHAPLLEEMKKLGFIRSIRVQEPYTHMAGGPRWDLRVTIVFRDAAAAVSDPEWDKQWTAAKERLYRDSKIFDSEEKTRFSLLEEHWDVIVNEVTP